MESDPWGSYYKSVYGTLPGSGDFPLHISDLWMLYDNDLISSRTQNLPPASLCPKTSCERYQDNDLYQPASVSWIWHAYPYSPIAPNTWAEVIHEADPFGDEGHGIWFQYAKGSGIWFNTGNTKVFNTHEEAYTYFNVAALKPEPGGWNPTMAEAAAKQNFDSVQFMQHHDHTNYQCDTHNTGRPGFEYLNFEIVGVKLSGTHACGASSGAPDTIRGGWQASQECQCDNKQQYLNCKLIKSQQWDVTFEATSSANSTIFLV
jgi:hypothetical protein